MTVKRSIHARMAAVFAGTGHVPKSGYNDFHKYHYVTEADMVAAIRPRMAAEGLYMLAVDDDVTVIEPGHVLLKTRYVITSEEGESIELTGFGEGKDVARNGTVGDKALYKAKTGALKYALMKSFMMDTGDDPERSNPERDATPKAAPQSKPAAARAARKAAPQDGAVTRQQVQAIAIALRETELDRDAGRDLVSFVIGRGVESVKDLTKTEASVFLDAIATEGAERFTVDAGKLAELLNAFREFTNG